jgi:hypothetical protein
MKKWFKKEKTSDITSTKTTVAIQKHSVKDALRMNLLPIVFLSYTFGVFIIVFLLMGGGFSVDLNQPPAQDDSGKFVDSWMLQSGTIPDTFAQNGSYCAGDFKVGSWKLQNGKFILTYGTGDVSFEYSYVFSNSDNTLTLTSSSSDTTKVYTRQ